MTEAAVLEAVKIHFSYQLGSKSGIILNMNKETIALILLMNSSIIYRLLIRHHLDERNTLYV